LVEWLLSLIKIVSRFIQAVAGGSTSFLFIRPSIDGHLGFKIFQLLGTVLPSIVL
jgi:hypothetical protein